MSFSKTLEHPVESDLEIKKSRFIGRIEAIHSQEEGLAKVSALWQQHPEARHVCFAMLVNGQVRQSDDGEPSGTAARPMLNVLQHKGLDNVVATVVRYFGGIKLGAGGLVRAYSQAISDPLNSALLIEVRPQSEVVIHFNYAHESIVRHLADQYGLGVDVHYAEKVTAKVVGELDPLQLFLELVTNQLRGDVDIHVISSQ